MVRPDTIRAIRLITSTLIACLVGCSGHNVVNLPLRDVKLLAARKSLESFFQNHRDMDKIYLTPGPYIPDGISHLGNLKVEIASEEAIREADNVKHRCRDTWP